MHEGDGHGAFAHRGRASFHRSMPHVSRSENAGHGGLEIIRMAVEQARACRSCAVSEVAASRDSVPQ
jgi:hypothetical protein